jgi:hypothetical protein
MMTLKKLMLAALTGLGLLAALPSGAATITVTAYDYGWYDSSGIHDISNTNTLSGKCCSGRLLRDFFIFNLSGVTGTVTGATLKFNSLQMGINSMIETWQLYDFGGDENALVAGTGGIAAYNDLGTGKMYVSVTFDKATQLMSNQSLTLNSFALNDLTANAGGKFAVGGLMQTFGAPDEDWVRWDGAAAQLVLTTQNVPEPVTLGLFGLGLLGLVAARRKSAK